MPKPSITVFLNADVIRELASERAWTLSRLAAEVGIDPKTLKRHLDEKNPEPATMKTIEKLSKKFSLPPTHFFQQAATDDLPVGDNKLITVLEVGPTEDKPATMGWHAVFADGSDNDAAAHKLIAAVVAILDLHPGILQFRYARPTKSLSIKIKARTTTLIPIFEAFAEMSFDSITLIGGGLATIDRLHFPRRALQCGLAVRLLESQQNQPDETHTIYMHSIGDYIRDEAARNHAKTVSVRTRSDGSIDVRRTAFMPSTLAST
jgi:hypothetical protein